MPVIDASVYVALVNTNEQSHDEARSWFREAALTQQTILAPSILVTEVASALSRGTDDVALARRVTSQIMHSRIIQLLPVTVALAEQAAAIAIDHRVRGCDAIYLALASQSNGTLITLDRQQLERGAGVIKTSRPESEE
ncbi:MAG: type II toxin-antitoxin system VapC family toxin [Caldilineales bacterium]|nr:type II toxin-antitoxin system VapC family toxin [Caldilineales bacterium]